MLPQVRAGSVSRCLTAPGPPGPPGLFCEPELQLPCNEAVNIAERPPQPGRRRCRKRLSRQKCRVAKYSGSGEEQLEQSEVLGAWLRSLFNLECRSDAPSLLKAPKLQRPVGFQWAFMP